MNKGILFIIIGYVIMSISVLDLTSVFLSITNIIFKLHLLDVAFSSFIYRTILCLIGGAIMFLEAKIYKKDGQ